MDACKKRQPCPGCGELCEETVTTFWCRNSRCNRSWFDKDKEADMAELRKAKPRGADQFSDPPFIKAGEL